MSEEQTLYERVGGEETVTRLVELFYKQILADDELGPFFQHADMTRQRSMMREFICAALGGPVNYTGRSIAEAHQGRGIKPRHVQRFVNILLDCLKEFNLTDRDVDQVISRINTSSDEVTGTSTVDG